MTQKQKRPTKPTIDDAGYKLLTSTACAKLLGITAQTVRVWCDDGRLEYFRGKGNVRYISMSEVERIRKQNAFTTVESAIERIEALNAQRDNEIRDLIVEKSSVQSHNFAAVDKRIATHFVNLEKRLDRLEGAAAEPPTIRINDKAVRHIAEVVLAVRDGRPSQPDELNHTQGMSIAERDRIGMGQ